MEDKEKLYLDQVGYEQYLANIEKLKLRLKDINLGRKDAFDAGAGDGWDSPEFEEIERQERIVMGELQRMYEGLSNIVIIEKHNNNEIIDIGDTLLVDMIFSADDREEFTFKLVGTGGNHDAGIQEVSINSPLGMSVYKKKIGDQTGYSVNGRSISVTIKQKKDLEKEQDGPTKKLSR